MKKYMPYLFSAILSISAFNLEQIDMSVLTTATGDGGDKDKDCNCGPADDGDPEVGYRPVRPGILGEVGTPSLINPIKIPALTQPEITTFPRDNFALKKPNL